MSTVDAASSDCFVSVVVPLHDVGPLVEEFGEEVVGVLEARYANHELVLIDDGSTDETAQRATGLVKRHKCVRLLRLSKRFGTEVATTSGLETAIGDFVVVLRAESDPPGLIPRFVDECQQGFGVVVGTRRHPERDPLWLRVGSRCFHWLARRVLRIPLIPHATEFRCFSRQVVNAITRVREKERHLRVLSAQVGFRSRTIPYDPVHRDASHRRMGLLEALSLAIEIAVSNSIHPLRFVTWLGLVASTINGLYVAYIFLIYFLKQDVVEGWATLSLQTAGMFFFVFLILTILSEYVGRILRESSDRPLYYVLSEESSTELVADPERRNVVTSWLGDPQPPTDERVDDSVREVSAELGDS